MTRKKIRGMRSVVLEHEAADMVDRLMLAVEGFDEDYRELEAKLSTQPDEIGISGVVCSGVSTGLYLHIAAWGAIDVLYRYDEERVCIESVAVSKRVVSVAS
jgi:hypothetical protein